MLFEVERKRCGDIADVVSEYLGYSVTASAVADLIRGYITDGFSAEDVKKDFLKLEHIILRKEVLEHKELEEDYVKSIIVMLQRKEEEL